jgi:hypothetical protein
MDRIEKTPPTILRCSGNMFTEPLPNNDRGDTHKHTDLWERFVKYAVEMGSGAMIYVPSLINIGLGIHNLTHRHQGDLISLLIFIFILSK